VSHSCRSLLLQKVLYVSRNDHSKAGVALHFTTWWAKKLAAALLNYDAQPHFPPCEYAPPTAMPSSRFPCKYAPPHEARGPLRWRVRWPRDEGRKKGCNLEGGGMTDAKSATDGDSTMCGRMAQARGTHFWKCLGGS